ncbi:MAG: hypothetical protein H0U38_07920 [Chloroflexia bacterium]|nr:hypothetical protein [Chloroflexia bacterium]MDQ3613045.1 YciI family protein [Chloroflexota bacterium]
MALFAVAITFVEDEERRLKVRPTHREYLQTLLDAGKLHESGPYTDDSGALLIYDAENEAEVKEIVANDPYTAGGVIGDTTIKEWNVVFSRMKG